MVDLHPAPRSGTLIFDGGCAVCVRFVAWVRRQDREAALELLPASAPGVRERFPALPREELDEAVHLVHGDGRIVRGADAIRETLAAMPASRWAGVVLGLPVVRGLARVGYAWFARHRNRFGCRAQ